jgi:hypothetical protein
MAKGGNVIQNHHHERLHFDDRKNTGRKGLLS